MLGKKTMEESLADERGFKLSGNGPEEVAKKIIEEIVSSSSNQTLSSLLANKEFFLACSYGLGRILAGYDTAFKSEYVACFYGNMKRMKAKKNSEYLLLKLSLTADLNAHIRNVKPFYIVVNILIEKVKNESDIKALIDFVDAVMAYHKYCGGR